MSWRMFIHFHERIYDANYVRCVLARDLWSSCLHNNSIKWCLSSWTSTFKCSGKLQEQSEQLPSETDANWDDSEKLDMLMLCKVGVVGSGAGEDGKPENGNAVLQSLVICVSNSKGMFLSKFLLLTWTFFGWKFRPKSFHYPPQRSFHDTDNRN